MCVSGSPHSCLAHPPDSSKLPHVRGSSLDLCNLHTRLPRPRGCWPSHASHAHMRADAPWMELAPDLSPAVAQPRQPPLPLPPLARGLRTVPGAVRRLSPQGLCTASFPPSLLPPQLGLLSPPSAQLVPTLLLADLCLFCDCQMSALYKRRHSQRLPPDPTSTEIMLPYSLALAQGLVPPRPSGTSLRG